MAFIFIPIELFKILVFFMQTAAGPAHYSAQAKIISMLALWRKNQRCRVSECEVIAYDVTTDTKCRSGSDSVEVEAGREFVRQTRKLLYLVWHNTGNPRQSYMHASTHLYI